MPGFRYPRCAAAAAWAVLLLRGSCVYWLLLGLLPGFEPRYAAPLLIGCMGAAGVVLAALEAVGLAVGLSFLVEHLWRLVLRQSGRLPGAAGLARRVEAARRRAGRLVDRYGVLGLALFVAAPLPVTGIYTGAVAALLLGLPRGRAAAALAAGGVASVLLTGLLAGGLRGLVG